MLSNIMYINLFSFFFFNDTPTTEIYTLSLHDALPARRRADGEPRLDHERGADAGVPGPASPGPDDRDGDPRARHRGPRGARGDATRRPRRDRSAAGGLGAVSGGGASRAPDDPLPEAQERVLGDR